MQEPRELQSLLDAADTAAATRDYASAEFLLREAARLQEARLGPLHPDLANTWNNLAIVCDMTDKPAEAERCYRRAVAIASAALAPDHPFVLTSRKNLKDFCQAHGRPVELLVPAVSTTVTRDVTRRDVAPSAAEPSTAVESAGLSSGRRHSILVGALAASGVLVMVMAVRPWFRWNVPAESPSAGALQSRPDPASRASSEPGRRAQVQPASPAPSATVSSDVRSTPAADDTATRLSRLSSTSGRRALAPPAAAGRLAVVEAHLCRNLSTRGRDWKCDPPNRPVGPGALLFYTRVTSPRDTTIQHRWYQDDRLRQAVNLDIGANLSEGYRTYSRNTINDQSAGDWKVELRTQDGVLLHEERFLVR